MKKGKNIQMTIGEFRYSSDSNGLGIVHKNEKVLAEVEYNITSDKYFVNWLRAQEDLQDEFYSVESILFYADENYKKVDHKIKFKHFLHDSKEGVYNTLSDTTYGIGLTEEEIMDNNLIYCFHEVELDCIYEDGEIYITGVDGTELKERVMA